MNTNHFTLSVSEIKWLTLNLHNYTSKQLFEYIMANRPEETRAGYTTFRTALYKKKLKKCNILRWTKKETNFLLENYKAIGNIQLAKELSTKRRPFTKKNVEKKIKLLKLKRTKWELRAIMDNHKNNGAYATGNANMWKTRGKAKDGERRVWLCNGSPRVVVKVDGVFVHYARHRFLELNGSINAGFKVYLKDGNPLNVDDYNLMQAPAGSVGVSHYKKHIKAYKQELKLKETVEVPKPAIQPIKHQPNGIAVRLDRKTIVYLKPGTNIEAFKKQFDNRPIL